MFDKENDRREPAPLTVGKPILDRLSSEVTSIVTQALSPLSADERNALHRQSWFTIIRRDKNAFVATLAFEATIERLQQSQAKNGTVFIQEAVLMECIHYLVWCEGPLNTILGEVCFLGVRAGFPFRSWRNSELVQLDSPQDIMDTSVSLKAGYLQANHVTFPQGVFDPKVRNAIAHMDFKLTPEGDILYWSRLSGRPEHTTLWKLQRRVWALRDVCITIEKTVADGIARYLQ